MRARWRRPEEPLEPRVRRLVAAELGVDPAELEPGVSLTDDLAADSLDVIELAVTLEERLGITIPEDVIDGLRTYGQLVEVVETHVRECRAREAEAEAARTPAFIWAHIRPAPSQARGSLQHAGWLTPYTAEAIVDGALRAGPGARLEMGVPPNLGEPALAELESAFAWLWRRDIAVRIRRDPGLPPVGVAA